MKFDNHKIRIAIFGKHLAERLSRMDYKRKLPFHLPTRLDQEINRCFVGHRTHKVELREAKMVWRKP